MIPISQSSGTPHFFKFVLTAFAESMEKAVMTEFDMHKIVFLQRGDSQRDICQKSCHILAWFEVSPQKM